MTTHARIDLQTERKTEKRISSYLLVEYLERIGVEVIFGLCGHTVIALPLDALGRAIFALSQLRHGSRFAAHAADGYAKRLPVK